MYIIKYIYTYTPTPIYTPNTKTHTANGLAEEEKAAAIRAYKANPGSIAAIYVGNEDLIPAGPFSVDEIIGHIQGAWFVGVFCVCIYLWRGGYVIECTLPHMHIPTHTPHTPKY